MELFKQNSYISLKESLRDSFNIIRRQTYSIFPIDQYIKLRMSEQEDNYGKSSLSFNTNSLFLDASSFQQQAGQVDVIII